MSRSIRIAPIAAALLAAATTACSDGPTSPDRGASLGSGVGAAGRVAEQPAALRIPILMPTATVRFRNVEGAVPLEGKALFTLVGTSQRKLVVDNGADDLDKSLGTIKTTFPATAGKLRVDVGAIAPYSPTKDASATATIGSTIDFGTLVLKRMPFVQADFVDAADGRFLSGGGLKVQDTWSLKGLAIVDDNGPGDHDLQIGRIKAYFDSDKDVTILQTKIPVGYQAPDIYMTMTKVAYEGSFNQLWKHKRFVY
jgi:hypothetical protein